MLADRKPPADREQPVTEYPPVPTSPGDVPAVSAAPANRMYRRRSGRTIAGVAGGLADHLGIDVLWVRLAFALLAVMGGAGVLAYGLLWMFIRQQPADAPPIHVTAKERQQAIGLVALAIGLGIGAGTISGSVNGWVAGGLAVALVGTVVVWREADRRQRPGPRPERRAGAVVRVITGAALVMTGLALFLIRSVDLGQVRFALLAVLATLVGIAVLTVPWWLRLVRDLGEERTARIRTQERAEIAAHLHDSVLQTLALIQKQADAPREVLRLARGQERQLRNWLYNPSGYARALKGGGATEATRDDGGQEHATLSEAVATACGEVEDTFAIQVQQVVVGDCELDQRLVALVQAAREAMVNAAKHAGVSEVSVYAEVEPERVTVFVRDRGAGFDPDAVPGDRHGLADSIRGRMERNNGEVRLRTAPGEGTEVQLHMPRTPARREAVR